MEGITPSRPQGKNAKTRQPLGYGNYIPPMRSSAVCVLTMRKRSGVQTKAVLANEVAMLQALQRLKGSVRGIPVGAHQGSKRWWARRHTQSATLSKDMSTACCL